MAQWAKCLLCKHQGPGFESPEHTKGQHTHNPSMTCRMGGRDGRIQNLKARGETSPVYAAINQNVSITGKERTVL